MKFLLIGFFRSGTTLLSNSLNSHPKIHCVVDPMVIFLKILRNKIFKYNKIKWNDDLENHIELKKKKFSDKIINFNLETKINQENINFIHHKLIKEKKYQHPNIDKIKKYKGSNTFINIFSYYLNKIQKLSKNKKKIIGTKMSWCEEYLDLFQKYNKNLKIIYIYRNIEDSINSALNSVSYINEAPSAVRPILYYVIYWKKSILFAHQNKNIYKIKYEDLIKNFNFEVNKIFDFLEVDNLKIKKFYDQYGNLWKNNSSFKKLTNSRNLILKKKRSKLFKELSDVINYLCKDELKRLGYKVKNLNFTDKNIINILKKYDKKLNFNKKYHKYLNYEKILKSLK